MAVRVTVQATDAFKYCSFGSGSWYTTERILQSIPSRLSFDVEAVVVLFVRSGETTPLLPWPFELRCKPPTLSSTASFGSGSWYTTEKDPARAIPFKTFRCDVEAVVVLLLRSGETTPLFNHGRSSYGASHRRFQVLQASVQVAGILRKDPAKEPFKTFRCDVEAVVVLLFVRSGETTPLFNHGFELRCKPPTLSSTAASVQVAGVLLKGSCKPYLSRPFVV
jgi:D-ribose pyranose/furanose isomerase RbsD